MFTFAPDSFCNDVVSKLMGPSDHGLNSQNLLAKINLASCSYFFEQQRKRQQFSFINDERNTN